MKKILHGLQHKPPVLKAIVLSVGGQTDWIWPMGQWTWTPLQPELHSKVQHNRWCMVRRSLCIQVNNKSAVSHVRWPEQPRLKRCWFQHSSLRLKCAMKLNEENTIKWKQVMAEDHTTGNRNDYLCTVYFTHRGHSWVSKLFLKLLTQRNYNLWALTGTHLRLVLTRGLECSFAMSFFIFFPLSRQCE